MAPTPAPRPAPAPGQVPLPAANAAALLRRNRDDADIGDRVALRFGERSWTHRELVTEAQRWGRLFLARRDPERPFHVGVLLDNTPDYVFALAAAGLVGATVVGLNPTRQGEHLWRDLSHTDVGLLVTEPAHLTDVADFADRLLFGPDRLIVSHRFPDADPVGPSPSVTATDLDDALATVALTDPVAEPDVGTPWALIFTSGTSGAPKAVICSQRRLLQTGARMAVIMDLGPDDVGYVCMPLFHSNAVMVGLMPALVVGASVGLARRFSASGWLPDVRRYGATWFNYTGKPLSYVLATPERPDDADNPLRVAFGNEGSPQVVEGFSRRFGVEVIDAFGATEGGVAVDRTGPDGTAVPGTLGVARPGVEIVDEQGRFCPPARFDGHGRLLNPDECVGEIVNTVGGGVFEGYYNNPEATEAATRQGWYWSGDLGYMDADRNLWFAGRTADWIRVDGENFPAGPIEAAVSRHPDVVLAAAYGVPDEQAGDQAMVAVVLRDGAELDPEGFASWVDGLPDIGPKWRPRYLRVADELPTTGTNKVVKRTLVHQKFRHDRVGDDALYVRLRGERAFRPFTAADETALRDAFDQAGRARFWDL